MKTVPTNRKTGTSIVSAQPDAPLPTILTEEVGIEGHEYPKWVPVTVTGSEELSVQRSLLTIEARLEPADPQVINVMLTALSEYYGVNRDKHALATTLAMMVEDLAGFSAVHVEAAIKSHRRDSVFFPKSAELRVICQKHRSKAMELRRRARVLLGLEKPISWELRALEMQDMAREMKARDSGEGCVDVAAKLAALPPPEAAKIEGVIASASKKKEAA